MCNKPAFNIIVNLTNFETDYCKILTILLRISCEALHNNEKCPETLLNLTVSIYRSNPHIAADCQSHAACFFTFLSILMLIFYTFLLNFTQKYVIIIV